MGLNTGQAVGGAVQGEVVQPDVGQKLQPGMDFPNDALGNPAASAGQLQVGKISQGPGDGQGRQGGQVVLLNEDVPGLETEPAASTVGAGLGAEIAGQLFPHGLGIGLPIAALHVGQNALEGMLAAKDIPAVIDVAEVDLLALAAMEHHLLVLGSELLEGGLHVDRKSTRLNSSHVAISYAVFCLKKKRRK